MHGASGDYYQQKSTEWCLFADFICWASYCYHARTYGPQTPVEKLSDSVNLSGQLLSLNHVFKILRGTPLIFLYPNLIMPNLIILFLYKNLILHNCKLLQKYYVSPTYKIVKSCLLHIDRYCSHITIRSWRNDPNLTF